MCNYGQLQVTFDDGSVGWYEAGWGPMMSETAFFVKDVVGPNGSVSIVKDPNEARRRRRTMSTATRRRTACASITRALDANQAFVRPDDFLSTEDEPDHQALCDREQAYLLRAIRRIWTLTAHWTDAVNSLRIVLAAEESARTGQVVTLT